MARILLVGSDRDTAAFAPLLLDGHQVSRHDHGDPATLPADVDLVVDFSGDDIRTEYPSGTIVFTNVLSTTATAATERAGGAYRLGLVFLPGLSERSGLLEISAPLGAPGDLAERGAALLKEVTGRQIEIVEDRIALVSARILAMVINEAAFALMEKVADAEDIDTAMKLGTNYPLGPLAWVDLIGADRIVAILDGLHREYGEERYRPAALLRQHARARQPFREAMDN